LKFLADGKRGAGHVNMQKGGQAAKKEGRYLSGPKRPGQTPSPSEEVGGLNGELMFGHMKSRAGKRREMVIDIKSGREKDKRRGSRMRREVRKEGARPNLKSW